MSGLKSLILIIFTISTLTAGESSWNGAWHVYWKSGSFSLTMEQHDQDINGSFEPEHGTLRGQIRDKTLQAVAVTENNVTMHIELTMSRSGASFFGSFNNGEWLTGVREYSDIQFNALKVNLSSPKDALYSFLILGNSVRSGEYRALNKAMSILQFPKQKKELHYSKRLEMTQMFFQILNECIVNKSVFKMDYNGDKERISLKQLGSEITVPIDFIKLKNINEWKIKLPSEEKLKQQLKELMSTRDYYEVDVKSNLKLKHPRATIRTLLEQYQRWEEGGKEYVISTMNLSNLNPSIRQWQAPRLAYYLVSVLNRISYIVFQEIPNDPKSRKPYIHFHHPVANIVIEPYEIDGKVKWQFSPKTLENIDALYYEMDTIKSKAPTKFIEENRLYFKLKQFARDTSKSLLYKVHYTELWQIIMLILILFVALMVIYVIQYIVNANLPKHLDKEMIDLKYLKPFQIIIFGTILLYGSHQLGLPNYLFSWINIFSQLLIILGLAWIVYNLVDALFSVLKKHAQKTSTDIDEIIVSLLGSLVRVIVIIIAAFMIAELFNISYKTVLAGLGIGGLAFAIAAKDTIANFFGSAIIIADTPFKTGDKIKIGAHSGVVTHVGIRSTKIKTSADTILTIPNNKITHEVIDNFSAREAMRLDAEFFLDIKTPKTYLDKLNEDILVFLSENESVVSDKAILTGINDYTQKGILFSVSFFTKAKKTAEYKGIRHCLISDIAEIIKQNGIEIIMVNSLSNEEKK